MILAQCHVGVTVVMSRTAHIVIIFPVCLQSTVPHLSPLAALLTALAYTEAGQG